MNREIKFRYWNGITNKMVNKPVIPTKREYEWSLEQYFSERGWIWMQYTGLKDKNGKEIWEGDIWSFEGNKFVVDNPIIGVFIYIQHHEMNVVELGEVIGNIYENPELLS